MGKHCIICGHERPNESFSGRGQGSRICKKCRTLPKADRQRLLDETFLVQALEQKNISEKNVSNFNVMRLRYSDSLGDKAAVMVELGSVHPRKKKRYGFLYHHKRDLYDRMVQLNMIEDWITPDLEDAEDELIMIENIHQMESLEIMDSDDDEPKEGILEL